MNAAVVDPELLEILRCWESKQRLHPASPELVARLNAARERGELRNLGGEAPRAPLDGGLVREDGARLYPVVDGIVEMLPESAIALEGFGGGTGGA